MQLQLPRMSPTPEQFHVASKTDSDMNISNIDGGAHPKTEAVIARLHALQPGKAQLKNGRFQELFPAIEQALARGVPQKSVVNELAKSDLSMSMGGFRSLLEAERKRRAELGDTLCCDSCGSLINNPDQLQEHRQDADPK